MSQARNSIRPDENGFYRVWCTPCDSEATFPTLGMAIASRKMHLCEGEEVSASWEGWDIFAWAPEHEITINPYDRKMVD